MAYSTLDDVKKALPEQTLIELTDDEAAGAVDQARVVRAIADADEEIDGYVGARHAVPLSTVPNIIRKYSVDIAVYNLFARRMIEAPEPAKEKYKGAIRFLEKVAEGKISLGASDPDGSPPDRGEPEMHADNPDRIFDRDKMSGF